MLDFVVLSRCNREQYLVTYRLYYRGVGFQVFTVLYKAFYYLSTLILYRFSDPLNLEYLSTFKYLAVGYVTFNNFLDYVVF